MKIEMQEKDLEWIAQTVHQAYHNPPEGKGGYWRDCQKTICKFIYDSIYRLERVKPKIREEKTQ